MEDTSKEQCLAAVFHGPGRAMELVRFPLPVLAEGEALVRIRCATICGSDLHTIFGRRTSPTPGVLGHEMTGEIVAGDVRDYAGAPLRVRDRVVWSMVWSCGDCFYCRRGLRPKCERLFKFGHERVGPGRALTGAYAEYCHLPAGTAIFRIPENVPDEIAAPANCATATVAAVMRTAGPLAGSRVLLMGAGMLGLTACAMAHAAGAGTVLAVEPNPARRGLARRFGATLTAGGGPSLREFVLAATEGRGVDTVLEFAGAPEACEAAIPLLRPGGHLVMAGSVFPSRPVALDAQDVVRRMLRISGVYNYAPEDLGEALRFLSEAQTRYPFAELTGGRYALAEIDAAVAFAEKEKPPRVAVKP